MSYLNITNQYNPAGSPIIIGVDNGYGVRP